MAAGHVAVVGAGLAGLSAAVALKDQGFTVDLFERSRLLGGKATSFTLDGIEVDNGQHVYLACCTEFVDFVRRLEQSAPPGLLPPDGVLQTQERFDALLYARNRRPARLRAVNLPAPYHLSLSLARYHHLGVADRVRVALALTQAKKPARPGETFAGWLARHRQSAAARAAFWDPFFVPALNAPLERVGAEDGLFVIRTAFLADAGAARFGFARVALARIAAAAASLLDEVNLRSPVIAVDVRWEPSPIVRGIVLAGGEHRGYDAVVLALPPARLASVVGDPAVFGLAGIERFETAPIVDVHLWYDDVSIPFEFAALLDSPVQWVFAKGPGYLVCSLSAALAHESTANDDLVAMADAELRTLLPELAGAQLRRGAATRDRDATFIPAPDLVRPDVSTTVPGLVVAGAWTDTGWPATMESAVRSGRRAAQVLAASLPAREEAAVG